MKTSTEKILARKEKELAIKEWWAKNRYKVNRVILFPLWVSVEIYNKRKEKRYKHEKWDKKRADTFLQYYILKAARWDKESNSLYFWKSCYSKPEKKFVKRKDRTFVLYYWFKIQDYLIDEFKLEEFTKIIETNDTNWVEIFFKEMK